MAESGLLNGLPWLSTARDVALAVLAEDDLFYQLGRRALKSAPEADEPLGATCGPEHHGGDYWWTPDVGLAP